MLNLNIIIIEPTIIPMDINSLNTPVWNASDILSRSLVILLSTAPGLFRSKNASGSRLSFSLTSFLSLKLRFSAKLAIRNDCMI